MYKFSFVKINACDAKINLRRDDFVSVHMQ